MMARYAALGTAAALLAVLALRQRFAVITVSGDSMMPTLSPGDQVLVRRTCLERLRQGQIVVAEMPGPAGTWTTRFRGRASRREWMIKRVAALPGDPLPQDCLPASVQPAGELVPPGRFVVLGDNLGWSTDSRQIGYVPAARLLGIVVRTIGHDRRPYVHPLPMNQLPCRTNMPAVRRDQGSIAGHYL
jgi:signal peptidase I